MRKKQSERWAHLIGKKFGKLTVLKVGDEVVDWYGCMIKCMCDCGSMRSVGRRYITRGQIKSCGCLNIEPRKVYS